MLGYGGGVGCVVQTVVIAVGYLQLEEIHRIAQATYQIARVELLVEHDLEIIVVPGKVRREVVKAQVLPENGDIVKAPGEQNGILAAELLKALHGVLKAFAFFHILLGDAGELGDSGGENLILLETAGGLELRPVLQPNGADLDDLKGQQGAKADGKGGIHGKGLIPLHVQYDH